MKKKNTKKKIPGSPHLHNFNVHILKRESLGSTVNLATHTYLALWGGRVVLCQASAFRGWCWWYIQQEPSYGWWHNTSYDITPSCNTQHWCQCCIGLHSLWIFNLANFANLPLFVKIFQQKILMCNITLSHSDCRNVDGQHPGATLPNSLFKQISSQQALLC